MAQKLKRIRNLYKFIEKHGNPHPPIRERFDPSTKYVRWAHLVHPQEKEKQDFRTERLLEDID